MENNTSKQPTQQAQVQQPLKRPDDFGRITVAETSLRIFDPTTRQVYVEKKE